MNGEASSSFTIAVAQPLCQPGDVPGNLERMEPLIAQAASERAQLVLFAEAGVTGYESSSRTLENAIVIGDFACQRLHELAHKYQIVIAAGFMEKSGNFLHISHGVFFPDGHLVLQRKARSGPVEPQLAGYMPGADDRVVFEIDGIRCAIAICADTGIPDLYNSLAKQGVQLLLVPTAGCGPRDLGFHEAALDDPRVLEKYVEKAESVVFSKTAIVTCRIHRMAMASCNQMADNGTDYFHPGHSMIVDSTGELSALIPGTFVFEHLRPRVAVGEIHPAMPG